MDKDVYEKIVQKKEFSNLPKKDVEKIYSLFEKRQTSEIEKIRLTRDLLRKVFSGFTSKKLLSLKDKDSEWILKKHLSTRERFNYYKEIYSRILKDSKEKISIIDLGAGINGVSYSYFQKLGKEVDYLSVEAIGQLVDLMNYYFKREKISGKAYHLSLFDLEGIKKILQKKKDPIVFLFKALDSLEMVERDYSKKLLKEIVPLSERVIVSFATRSFIKRTRFKAKRSWLINFITDNFKIRDDFELGGERYIVFSKK